MKLFFKNFLFLKNVFKQPVIRSPFLFAICVNQLIFNVFSIFKTCYTTIKKNVQSKKKFDY